jgi:hypothetical protein
VAERADDLLQPTLTGRRVLPGADRPWRLSSQVYVALFGGVMAIAPIAAMNAHHFLGMPRKPVTLIWVSAVVAEIALIAVAAIVDLGVFAQVVRPAFGLLAFAPMYLLQRSPDRVHHFHHPDPDPYDSLLRPGLLVCGAAWLLEGGTVRALQAA